MKKTYNWCLVFSEGEGGRGGGKARREAREIKIRIELKKKNGKN